MGAGRERQTERGAGVNGESPQQTWVKFPHSVYQSRRTNTAVLDRQVLSTVTFQTYSVYYAAFCGHTRGSATSNIMASIIETLFGPLGMT